MKKINGFRVLLITFMVIMVSTTASYAETAQKFNLSVGGYFGIGGATDMYDYDNDDNGAFAFGIQPEMQFFPIDKLAINFRCLWERIFYDFDAWGRDFDVPVDVFPFIFGARYYFPIIDNLKLFAGGGLGFSIIQAYYPDWWRDDKTPDPEIRFSLDINGGIEYEVVENLALTGMFDIFLPNLAPVDTGEDVIARFMFFFGVSYYFQL